MAGLSDREIEEIARRIAADIAHGVSDTINLLMSRTNNEDIACCGAVGFGNPSRVAQPPEGRRKRLRVE